MEEIKIAQALLSATSKKTIQSYLVWLREYSNKKFFDNELGKKINALRSSFYHDGSEKAINKFWKKHEDLSEYCKMTANKNKKV